MTTDYLTGIGPSSKLSLSTTSDADAPAVAPRRARARLPRLIRTLERIVYASDPSAASIVRTPEQL